MDGSFVSFTSMRFLGRRGGGRGTIRTVRLVKRIEGPFLIISTRTEIQNSIDICQMRSAEFNMNESRNRSRINQEADR